MKLGTFNKEAILNALAYTLLIPSVLGLFMGHVTWWSLIILTLTGYGVIRGYRGKVAA